MQKLTDAATTNPIWRFVWQGLSFSLGYRTFGALIGANGFRSTYVKQYVRPRAGDKVLDIGCGPGDILGYFPSVNYIGFDTNAEYIQAARKRFGQRGSFHQQAITRELVGSFSNCDLVMANGLLHHLGDNECLALFELAHAALKNGGRLITLDGVFAPHQSRLARYLVSRDRGRFVRTEREYVALGQQVFANIKPHILNGQLRIPYTHLVMECEK